MIRNAVESDLERIVAVYNASIPGRMATADTEPLTVDSRRGWLRDRDDSRYPVWVFARQGQVVAWLSFNPFYGRPAYAGTAEVSVYVDPAARRGGVATALLEKAIREGPELGLSTFLAFVFAHNQPSLSLCRNFGFQQWGHLPRIAVLDGVERDLLILGKRLERRSDRPG